MPYKEFGAAGFNIPNDYHNTVIYRKYIGQCAQVLC
jgi:hypothetical protein